MHKNNYISYISCMTSESPKQELNHQYFLTHLKNGRKKNIDDNNRESINNDRTKNQKLEDKVLQLIEKEEQKQKRKQESKIKRTLANKQTAFELIQRKTESYNIIKAIVSDKETFDKLPQPIQSDIVHKVLSTLKTYNVESD